MAMNRIERTSAQIDHIYRLCRNYSFLSTWSVCFISGMFAAGTLIILCRFFQLPFMTIPALCSLAVMISLLSALMRTRKNALTVEHVAGWIEKECNAGGLIISTFHEHSISGWEDRLEKIIIPACRIRWLKAGMLFMSGIVFAILCTLVPVPRGENPAEAQRLNIGGPASDLREKIKVLAEVAAIDKDRMENLEEMLKRLEENRSALQPGRIFESLDAMESALKELGDNASKSLVDSAELAQKMEMAAAQLEKSPGEEMEKKLRNMAEKLSEMMKDMPCAADLCMKGGMSAQEALESFLNSPQPMSEEQLRQLAETLKQCKSSLSGSMKKILKAGCCSAEAEALKNFLECNRGNPASSGNDAGILLDKDGPGKGGVNRGRGDAPMVYGSESPVLASEKKENLNPDKISMDFNETVGVSFSEPEIRPVDDDVQGALATGAGNGGQANRYKVAPGDKTMLRNYFKEK